MKCKFKEKGRNENLPDRKGRRTNCTYQYRLSEWFGKISVKATRNESIVASFRAKFSAVASVGLHIASVDLCFLCAKCNRLVFSALYSHGVRGASRNVSGGTRSKAECRREKTARGI